MPDTWPTWISSSKHVAEAVDWVRWKTQGRAKLVIAIGANSISVAKNRELDPEDAIAILGDLQDQIAKAIRAISSAGLTHASTLIKPR
jgi:hypothetical protein